MSSDARKQAQNPSSKGPRITIDSATYVGEPSSQGSSKARSKRPGAPGSKRPRKTRASKSRSSRPRNPQNTHAVAGSYAPGAADSNSAEGQTDPRQMGSELRSTFAGYTESFRTWLDGLFPGHGNAAFFALIGFVVALVFITIGFMRTLVVLALVVVGLAFGQQLDGNPKILRALKRLLNSNRRR